LPHHLLWSSCAGLKEINLDRRKQFYIQKQPAQILSGFVAQKEEVVAFMMLVLISKHKRAISRKLPQFWTKIIYRPWPYS